MALAQQKRLADIQNRQANSRYEYRIYFYIISRSFSYPALDV